MNKPLSWSGGCRSGRSRNQYERYRLGYPDELVDAVVHYAGGPLRSTLEVGAGTGKSTRLFASRGIEATALEPDAEMAHVLERTTRGISVKPEVTTFEEFGTARHFDMVYAAAAWHWTDPASRWPAPSRCSSGGVLALFGFVDGAVYRARPLTFERAVLRVLEGCVISPLTVSGFRRGHERMMAEIGLPPRGVVWSLLW